ncbi:hypothetical protein [Pseudoalteromonas viridis]|uniref:Uncharacterized protein n=1 Tax=Pseudoalteromonas viridis TaxID=339617 RepID=A0ABX7V7Z5_9GAMM|nr:hypothetical protein [Pseudoalteromonas viridis]QTL35802.1 hypothetical protein J5X90_01695 [Pseudoalteromonas viridis]
MHSDLNNAITPKTDSAGEVFTREVLKLSELDSELLSDVSNMFGKWFETDHCDKDIR